MTGMGCSTGKGFTMKRAGDKEKEGWWSGIAQSGVSGEDAVAQVSKPAVSRVSKPAKLTTTRHGGVFHGQPIGKSAIQQVWKPAPRLRLFEPA
jgi:hypothetical protein